MENGIISLRRKNKEDVDIDITPMIDVVFLLLIFFIVCSTMGKDSSVELPKAKYGVGINPKTSTVLTVAGMEKDSKVFFGDGTGGQELSKDKMKRDAEIVQYIDKGVRAGKTEVIIRADRRLHHGEVVRIESAVSSVPGINMFVIIDSD